MKVSASAPGKAILFGEHSVVYGKPAIAVAVDKRARVTIKEGTNNTEVKIPQLDIEAVIDAESRRVTWMNSPQEAGKFDTGILEYIQVALSQLGTPLDGLKVEVDLEIPIGAGLGSSAAITVATLAAAARYTQQEVSLEALAHTAHQVELQVQGAASPLDTTVSTQGGFIYFTHEKGAMKIKPALEMPLVVGYTSKPGNTGVLVEGVRKLRETQPTIVNPILDIMEDLANQARKSIIQGRRRK